MTNEPILSNKFLAVITKSKCSFSLGVIEMKTISSLVKDIVIMVTSE